MVLVQGKSMGVGGGQLGAIKQSVPSMNTPSGAKGRDSGSLPTDSGCGAGPANSGGTAVAPGSRISNNDRDALASRSHGGLMGGPSDKMKSPIPKISHQKGRPHELKPLQLKG